MIRILNTIDASGFRENPAGLETLNSEDRFRLTAFIAGINEVEQNWHFQCQQGLLDAEICGASYESQVRYLLGISRGLGLSFRNNRPRFIADLRRIGDEAGMPVPDENGRWPQ